MHVTNCKSCLGQSVRCSRNVCSSQDKEAGELKMRDRVEIFCTMRAFHCSVEIFCTPARIVHHESSPWALSLAQEAKRLPQLAKSFIAKTSK